MLRTYRKDDEMGEEVHNSKDEIDESPFVRDCVDEQEDLVTNHLARYSQYREFDV